MGKDKKNRYVIVNNRTFRLYDLVGRLRFHLFLEGDPRLEDIDRVCKEEETAYLYRIVMGEESPNQRDIKAAREKAVWNYVENNHRDLYAIMLQGVKGIKCKKVGSK